MEKVMEAVKAMTETKKAMKATKGTHAKKKRVSKVAKGRLAKYLVFKGTKEKTVSGLTKEETSWSGATDVARWRI